MLPLLLTLTAAASPAEGCATVDAADLLAGEGPRILVLGERPGDPLDLRRATRLVRALRDRGPVTLGLEAVPHRADGALQALRAPVPDLDAVADATGWDDAWTAPVDPYRPLLALGLTDVPAAVTLTAVGVPEAPPVDPDVDVPAGEPERLARLAGGELSYRMRQRLAEARAWSDARLADHALSAWDGQGVLVLLVDQTRVAARGGLAWHLRQHTEAEVTPVVLSWTEQACTGGTLVWRPPTLRAALPGFAAPEAVEIDPMAVP